MSQRKYIIEKIGEYYPRPDDTTFKELLYIVRPNDEWDGQDAWDDGFLEEIKQDMPDLFPSVRCEHDYDCCGHWYPNRGCILDRSYDYVIVSQSWYMHV